MPPWAERKLLVAFTSRHHLPSKRDWPESGFTGEECMTGGLRPRDENSGSLTYFIVRVPRKDGDSLGS